MSPEARLQADIVQWLQSEGYYFCSIPNEAKGRSAVGQMQLIAMGLRPGAADMVVILPEGRVVWVEVKDEKGKQSPSQIKFENRVRELGHNYYVVKNIEQIKNIFKKPIDEKGE
jgi:elongation factor P hydroxylase